MFLQSHFSDKIVLNVNYNNCIRTVKNWEGDIALKFIIHWIYTTRSGKTVSFRSDWINDEDILDFIEDLERTGRTMNIEIEDETGQGWTKKELKKLLLKLESEPDDFVLYFDGNFEKETGMAGLGVVITYRVGEQKFRKRSNQKIGPLSSNNEAEVAALYFGLQELEEWDVRRKKVVIKGDSHTIIMQCTGEWPSYDEILNRWFDRVEEKIERLGILPTFISIPRTENKECDKLSRQALTGIKIESRHQLKDSDEKR